MSRHRFRVGAGDHASCKADGVTPGQRTALVVALGGAFAVAAATTNRLLPVHGTGGWFMYAPNNSATYSIATGSDGHTLRAAAVWLVAIGLWFVCAWRLFRRQSDG